MENLDIFNTADKCLELSKKIDPNVKCTEIYIKKTKYINIEIEENSVKNSESGSDLGISIRAFDKRGSLGFAFTNKTNKFSIESMIRTAIKMMKAGTDDPDFEDLPLAQTNYPTVTGLFDKTIKELQVEDSMQYVRELINTCKEDEQAISQAANFTSNYSKVLILNSNGLEVRGKKTNCIVSSRMIARDKFSNDTSFGVEWQSVRNLKEIDAILIAQKALKNAKNNLNRKKINNMKCPLVLTPNGAISLILEPLISAINAETFQYNRSFLVGKRGAQVGSIYLNVEDKALIDNGSGSAVFDGEGVPCRDKIIINNGTFLESGLLHNSYTANKEGTISTGNASRSSYSSVPSINCTNFLLNSGEHSSEEIIEDMKHGIILDYTGDSPNIATGDFSGLILQGSFVKNGEIIHPLNETMLAINLIDLFRKIDAISKEYSVYGSFQAPYVRIDDVNILGGGDV
ncbi:MAG: TldD/PmbA family protein [Candidatus Lokiarchaeota archaeon]|nr:TldD/PmbA family protein [Candidatus Lokiarchaeota archaeon]